MQPTDLQVSQQVSRLMPLSSGSQTANRTELPETIREFFLLLNNRQIDALPQLLAPGALIVDGKGRGDTNASPRERLNDTLSFLRSPVVVLRSEPLFEGCRVTVVSPSGSDLRYYKLNFQMISGKIVLLKILPAKPDAYDFPTSAQVAIVNVSSQ
ncbi:hypothetical protein EN41_11245 [Agrobacterium tumefaciens]|uniref:Uncharacterized protein n=1 Tax=Agrobacterium fabrum (strain C58 / ATCC 33970) TaxID=176299 RepID=A9CHA3_AGRFC|nr:MULTISPECIES: hypothetical protein [Agrobacterium]AAK88568.1 hypothetical protein Atu4879 [Agrobacterium fabrum str. C58]KEY50014.1 hypothetical protein EN41_11245 [Agrobacterium tumefaciens]KJX85421.1 hypothetical protein SY94_4826 [Agrobacterium tumefaciens]MCX2878508.1 hypothetical protein [Agrobacterium fabrum]NMV73028.1 hypothetical protein [Agrobacterium fabrum]